MNTKRYTKVTESGPCPNQEYKYYVALYNPFVLNESVVILTYAKNGLDKRMCILIKNK